MSMSLTQPPDLAPYMATIEAVQEQVNAAVILWKPIAGAVDGPCVAYASAKIDRLGALGIKARFVMVTTEAQRHGPTNLDHAVVEVDGILRGKPVHLILDIREGRVVTKEELSRAGYTNWRGIE